MTEKMGSDRAHHPGLWPRGVLNNMTGSQQMFDSVFATVQQPGRVKLQSKLRSTH